MDDNRLRLPNSLSPSLARVLRFETNIEAITISFSPPCRFATLSSFTRLFRDRRYWSRSIVRDRSIRSQFLVPMGDRIDRCDTCHVTRECDGYIPSPIYIKFQNDISKRRFAISRIWAVPCVSTPPRLDDLLISLFRLMGKISVIGKWLVP